MKAFLLTVGTMITLMALALIPPTLMLQNQETYETVSKKVFVEYAETITDQTLENPIEQLLVRGYQITINEESEGEPREATVKAITFFGLTYANVNVNPHGASVESRWF